MGDQRNGGIAWCDETWNPLRGCSRISPGCVNCYAEIIAARFSGPGQAYDGLAKRTPRGGRWTGKVRLVEERLEDPLRWKKPRRIFVNSMSDLFHEGVEEEWIDRIFSVMMEADQHTYQVLTKRPERMRDYVTRLLNPGLLPEILRPVHLGVSVEDQATADARIPVLLTTPAAVRWVSYEPALGPVDFAQVRVITPEDRFKNVSAMYGGCGVPRLDWIVVGGESGPGARPFDLAWARSTVEQCRAAGVPVFCKQMGARPVAQSRLVFSSFQDWVNKASSRLAPGDICRDTKGRQLRRGEDFMRARDENAFPVSIYTLIRLLDRKGDDMAEWPEDLRVREYPTSPPDGAEKG